MGGTPRRTRVVVVTKSFPPAFRSGGPSRSIAGIVEALRDECDFRIVTTLDDNGHDLRDDGVPDGRWTERLGVPVVAYPPGPAAPLRILWQVHRLEPDVLHLNTLFHPAFGIAPLVAHRLGLARRSKVVLAPRGELGRGALGLKSRKKARFLAVARRLGLFRGLVWHATSPGEVDEIRALAGPDVRVHLAPELRDLDVVDRAARPPRPAADRRAGPRVVLLSKIDRKKNIVGAIEAIARSSGQATLAVAGPIKEADYWEECLAAARRLGVEDRVTYAGLVGADDVVSFLSDYDLFVLPTLGENFGHVVLEALAAGVPVLLSDTTRWSDVETAGAGWICPVDDLAAFAARIDELAALDDDACAAMAGAAARFARDYMGDDDHRRRNLAVFRDEVPVRIAVVSYAFPVTTQTFHHRRHRVFAEAGVLRSIHFVRPHDGVVEASAAGLLDLAHPITARQRAAALASMLRPPVAAALLAGLARSRPGNSEGGPAGFAYQAWNGAALGRELRHGDADVIHAPFEAAAATVACFAALTSGRPWSVEVHSPASALANPRLLAWKLARADVVFAISEYARDLVARLGRVDGVHVVHCGLDPLPAAGGDDDAEVFDVVAVGSLIAKKGHDVLIAASARLQPRLAHRVAIVGGGPLADDLTALIAETGAPVTLLGELPPDRVRQVVARARVGALACVRTDTGDEDGIPVALMELMQAGVPVVSTRVAGIAELLEDGEAGGLVDPGRPDELADALERALRDEGWRAEVVDRAHRRIDEAFDNRRETERLVGLLGELVARR